MHATMNPPMQETQTLVRIPFLQARKAVKKLYSLRLRAMNYAEKRADKVQTRDAYKTWERSREFYFEALSYCDMFDTWQAEEDFNPETASLFPQKAWAEFL